MEIHTILYFTIQLQLLIPMFFIITLLTYHTSNFKQQQNGVTHQRSVENFLLVVNSERQAKHGYALGLLILFSSESIQSVHLVLNHTII